MTGLERQQEILPRLQRDPTGPEIEHFLRRAAFAAESDEVDRVRSDGLESTVRRLLGSATDASDREADAVEASLSGSDDPEAVAAAWIWRLQRTRHPLRENLVLFLHNRFVSALAKVGRAGPMFQQTALFRELGSGAFRDLTRAVTRDPAMIRYLDLERSTKSAPNENFARELLELFTMGPGPYTEIDVKEAARAFTGHRIRDERFAFSRSAHDPGPKTFLGRVGPFDGDAIVDLAVAHPATPHHLSRALLLHFVTDRPSENLVRSLASNISARDGHLGLVLADLFASEAFYAEEHRFALTRSPIALVLATARALGHALPPTVVARHVTSMGQVLLDPPSVKGYEGGAAWRQPITLLARRAFLVQVAAKGRWPHSIDPKSPTGLADLAHHLLGRAPEPAHLDAIRLSVASRPKAEEPERLLRAVLFHPWFQEA